MRSRTTAILLLPLGLLGCFFRQAPLRGLGQVDPAQLCSDASRCDVRGDAAVNLIKGRKASPIHLAERQSPESYLGKVAPDRNAHSVLKSCSGDVTKDDILSTGPSARVVGLEGAGKQQLRASLKAHVARALLEQAPKLTPGELDVEALSEDAVRPIGLQKISMISQTFWLKDAAFERRVAQCGEEEYGNIIYSLTLLRLSELTQKELESKLIEVLAGKLGDPPEDVEPPDFPPPTGEDDGDEGTAPRLLTDPEQRRKLLRELAYAAVRELSGELRMIAALGFDDP